MGKKKDDLPEALRDKPTKASIIKAWLTANGATASGMTAQQIAETLNAANGRTDITHGDVSNAKKALKDKGTKPVPQARKPRAEKPEASSNNTAFLDQLAKAKELLGKEGVIKLLDTL